MKSIYLPLNTMPNRKGRNHNTSLFLNEKPKTISEIRHPPATSRTNNPPSILSFPLPTDDNDSHFPSYLFSTTTRFYNPLKKILPVSNIFKNKIRKNNNIKMKKISKSLFNRPVINSKTIEKKIKESKKAEKLKNINIFDFGNNLKLYDEEEKRRKEKKILEKINNQLNEIYYDYDKSNKNAIMNSFSGNSANLLKNKICFVKGIVDYLYPKLILQKIDFFNDIKAKQYKIDIKNLHKSLRYKYYKTKHRSPEENAAISKYIFGGNSEIIRPRKFFFEPKKTLINKCKVLKLTYDYDYI
jgi:hypothetical protein